MPLYEYLCHSGHRTTAFRKMDSRTNAPSCHICHLKTELRIAPTMVGHFESYRTVAYDKERGERMNIRSRAEHESFLARNGFEEVGNDASMAPPCQEEIRHLEEQNVEFNYDPDTQKASL